jgi:hypothetical protein
VTRGIYDRRRRAVSLSMPVTSNDPIEQLNLVIQTFQGVNQILKATVLGREELIALGGLLTPITHALVTFTDLLDTHADRSSRTHPPRPDSDTTAIPAASTSLQHYRDGLLAASTAAQTLRAELKRCL